MEGQGYRQKELEVFMRKTKVMSVKLWYVSKAGFTAEAEAYADANGIMLSGEAELQRLTYKLTG